MACSNVAILGPEVNVIGETSIMYDHLRRKRISHFIYEIKIIMQVPKIMRKKEYTYGLNLDLLSISY